MIRESQDLIESLNQLVDRYRQLLQLVLEEQKALVETEFKGLGEINLAKEKRVLEIKKLEGLWTQSAKALGQKIVGFDSETPSLKELAKEIGGEIGEEFFRLHSILSVLVKEIAEMNIKNKTLTQSALSHINGAMQAIAETFKETPTYGKGGKVREEAVGGSGRLLARQA